MVNLLHQKKLYSQNRNGILFLTKRIIFLFFFFPIFVHAQNYQVKSEDADCTSPIILTDTIFGPTNAPEGYGSVNEFQDVLGSLYSFEKEHHTVWFRFAAPGTGTLTFDIIPECVKDDYDFLLFKYSGNENNFCDNIKNKKLKPIRTAISRNDRTIGSTTGLKEGATQEFIHSGPGESYSKPLDVKKNDVYCLVLDNVYENGCGFTLKLHFKFPPFSKSLNITVLDSLTNEMINADISVLDSTKKDTSKKIFQKNASSCFLPLDSGHIYTIAVSAKGYFPKSLLFKPVSDEGLENLNIRLTKIEAGSKVILENIYFYGNSDVFLPASNASLKVLLKTMNDNPNLKIEVQGHVNAPCNSVLSMDTAWNRKLSLMRAKAICKYLTDNGVGEDRLSFRGFGNSHMLFPYAKTEKEMEMNRRVEIMVISNEE